MAKEHINAIFKTSPQHHISKSCDRRHFYHFIASPITSSFKSAHLVLGNIEQLALEERSFQMPV